MGSGLRGKSAPKLADIVATVQQNHEAPDSPEIRVEANPALYLRLSEAEAVRIVGDVMAMALQHPHVQKVSISQARKPSEDRVSVFAEHATDHGPGFRMLGQNRERCQTVRGSGWPRGCYAAWFDNGYEYVYQITVPDEIA